MSGNFIPLSVPNLKGNELKYVTEAITTEWVSTGGPFIVKFEEQIANHVNAKGAVSCQNGTAGIHTALMVTGFTSDDEIIVPTLTFIAAVNPVKYIGAEPIFMDCDDSLTMDSHKLESFCENECLMIDGKLINKITKKHVKGIIVVHVFGNMADMVEIMRISKKYNLIVIEDATEALGTYYIDGDYEGKYAGTIGDIGVYSFNGNKIITTGGGGMIVSDKEEYLVQAKHLTTQAKSDELFYTHDVIGYNYRMTNVQAALGLAQLEQLDTFIQTKKKNYMLAFTELKTVANVEVLKFRDDINPNYWFYSVHCLDGFPLTRNELIYYFQENNVQTRPIWGLISEQKPYRKCQSYKIEKARYFLDRIINIPSSSNLTESEIMRVVSLLRNIQERE